MATEPLTKLALYGSGPFFANPFKIIANSLAGISYEKTFAHFRRDHQDPQNLGLHLLCLAFQLIFNYSLLDEVDQKLAKLGKSLPESSVLGKLLRRGDALASSTTLMWLSVLLRAKGAPISVKALSFSCVTLAYLKRNTLSSHWRSSAGVTAVLEMVGMQVFLLNGKTAMQKGVKGTINAAQLGKLLAVRWALQALLAKATSGGAAPVGGRLGVVGLNVALGSWMFKVAQNPFSGGGPSTSPFTLFTVGGLLALATDQPWLYFYSGGYLASIAQGVAHHFAGEVGTLPQLSNVGAELSHVTYFPNILWQSVRQSLLSGRGEAPLLK